MTRSCLRGLLLRSRRLFGKPISRLRLPERLPVEPCDIVTVERRRRSSGINIELFVRRVKNVLIGRMLISMNLNRVKGTPVEFVGYALRQITVGKDPVEDVKFSLLIGCESGSIEEDRYSFYAS